MQGAILKEGIVDGTPMFQNIEDYFLNKTLKRAVNIGITNIMNGKNPQPLTLIYLGTYVSFNEKFNSSDLVNVLKASIATPGVFAPVIAWDSFWFSNQTYIS